MPHGCVFNELCLDALQAHAHRPGDLFNQLFQIVDYVARIDVRWYQQDRTLLYNPFTMNARPATSEDVPAIIALVTRTLAEFGIVFGQGSSTDDQLRKLPGSYAEVGGRFFVVEIDGVLVGTAGIFPLAAGVYELRKMYLDPAARGRGVGQCLLDAGLRYVRECGGRRVVLDTTEQMTAAIAFYEKNGFVRDDVYISAPRCSRGYRRDL